MYLIDELNEVKKRLKIKNVDIAKSTGISQSYISDIFNKRSYPSLQTFIKIAHYLNLNVSIISEDKESYSTDGEISEITSKYLRDFSTWPSEDKEDLIEYLQSKRKIIDLKKKDRT